MPGKADKEPVDLGQTMAEEIQKGLPRLGSKGEAVVEFEAKSAEVPGSETEPDEQEIASVEADEDIKPKFKPKSKKKKSDPLDKFKDADGVVDSEKLEKSYLSLEKTFHEKTQETSQTSKALLKAVELLDQKKAEAESVGVEPEEDPLVASIMAELAAIAPDDPDNQKKTIAALAKMSKAIAQQVSSSKVTEQTTQIQQIQYAEAGLKEAGLEKFKDIFWEQYQKAPPGSTFDEAIQYSIDRIEDIKARFGAPVQEAKGREADTWSPSKGNTPPAPSGKRKPGPQTMADAITAGERRVPQR